MSENSTTIKENLQEKITCFDCVYFGGHFWQDDTYWCRYNYADKSSDGICNAFYNFEDAREVFEHSQK